MQDRCTTVIILLGYTFSYPTVVLVQILQLITMLNTSKVQCSTITYKNRMEFRLLRMTTICQKQMAKLHCSWKKSWAFCCKSRILYKNPSKLNNNNNKKKLLVSSIQKNMSNHFKKTYFSFLFFFFLFSRSSLINIYEENNSDSVSNWKGKLTL